MIQVSHLSPGTMESCRREQGRATFLSMVLCVAAASHTRSIMPFHCSTHSSSACAPFRGEKLLLEEEVSRFSDPRAIITAPDKSDVIVPLILAPWVVGVVVVVVPHLPRVSLHHASAHCFMVSNNMANGRTGSTVRPTVDDHSSWWIRSYI
jgi:hypothetical protein